MQPEGGTWERRKGRIFEWANGKACPGKRSEQRHAALEGSAQSGRDTETKNECPKAVMAFKLCAASLRGTRSS